MSQPSDEQAQPPPHSETAPSEAATGSFALDGERGATASPLPLPLPAAFGDYEFVRRIAHGGMGVVYQARHKRLNRMVALKMLLAGSLASSEYVQRFLSEASAAAQLDHPGIVPIYEIGQHQEQHYFSMAFVEGGSLAERVRQGPLVPREAAELTRQVAEAVAYAHQHGIIHRDLKPANILLDRKGQPKVTDFGLAKQVQDVSDLTLSGQIIGTPTYMPPEQAAGKGDQVGPAADIYSIGAVLYCLLTGRPPFQAARSVETLKQVLEQEPVSPRQLNNAVSRDLETICLKCVQKQPAKRYASASALAEDLQRFLAGEPIRARPVSRVERCLRWCRRNKVVAALAALCATSLLGGTIVASLFAVQAYEGWRQAEENAELADREARAARAAQLLSDRRWYVAELGLAQQDWQDGQMSSLLKRLDRVAQRPADEPDLRGFEWHYLRRLTQLEYTTFAHGHQVAVVAFSPNGRLLAVGGGDTDQPGVVQVWDLATHAELRTLHTADAVRSVCFSPDGQWLAAGSGSWGKHGAATVWESATGAVALQVPHEAGPIFAVAFSADSRQLALGGGAIGPTGLPVPTAVALWDVATAKRARSLGGQPSYVKALAYSSDGRWLATGAADGKVRVWDPSRGTLEATLEAHTGPITSIAFRADGRRCATASGDQLVKVWDVDTWRQPGTVPRELLTLRHGGPVETVAFGGPRGERLATGGAERGVRVWDLATGSEAFMLRGHTARVLGVAFAPDGRRLASVGEDLAVKLWDATVRPELRQFALDTVALRAAVDPDGQRVALACHDRTVRLLELRTGLEVDTRYGHAGTVMTVAYRHDGRQFASASEDRTIRLWSVQGPRDAQVLLGHTGPVRTVVYRPDGEQLASASEDGTVKLWAVGTGALTQTLHGPFGPMWTVAYNLDGTVLASAGAEPVICLWDAATGALTASLRGHRAAILCVAFSPDGKLLASASQDRTVRIWDVASRRELYALSGHAGDVWSVAFSRDGRRLAATGGNHVNLWDLTTGQELLTLRGPTPYEFYSVVFTPDDQCLVATSLQPHTAEQAVLIWDCAPLSAADRDEREAQRVLAYAFAQVSTAADAAVRIRVDVALRDTVRQQALALLDGYAQARVRRQATRLVQSLFHAAHLRAEVLEQLRSNPALDDAVRREALAVAERFVESARQLAQASWAVAARADRPRAEYERALRCAERACELAPYEAAHHVTRGMVCYRLGDYRTALAALTLAERDAQPSTLAFVAMTQLRLGQCEQARLTQAHLQALLKQPRWANDNDANAFAAESNRILAEAAPAPKQAP